MKILANTTMVTTQVAIEHGGTYYIRVAQSNGDVMWSSTSYEHVPSGVLEKFYQKLIKKPVTTTNEQPKCQCQVNLNKCDNCSSANPS